MPAAMRLLDLFCGAGGASVGFARAGFEVVGVDIEPQKNYPFEFHQADWLTWLENHWREFDLVAASPPCQGYSVTKGLSNGNHPMLIEPVREALRATGKPYIIENVPGAPLINPLMLCGTMFPGLRVRRHRLFECWPVIWWPPAACSHWSRINENGFCTLFGTGAKDKGGNKAMWQQASGINWMTCTEMAQAIPPAYTEYVGNQIKELI